jgi:hypothetical protein
MSAIGNQRISSLLFSGNVMPGRSIYPDKPEKSVKVGSAGAPAAILAKDRQMQTDWMSAAVIILLGFGVCVVLLALTYLVGA